MDETKARAIVRSKNRSDLPTSDYVFKYLDKDDVERIRQRIMLRRKLQLLNDVRNYEMQIQRETVQPPSDMAIAKVQRELVKIMEVETMELSGSDRSDGEKTPLDSARGTKPFEPKAVIAEKHSKGVEKIQRSPSQSRQPRPNSNQTVEKPPAEPFENNAILLTRLTTFQQSIDAKLDEIIPALKTVRACDGPVEMEKFERMFADHLKVLSRNYLYQIECIISEIRQPLPYNEFSAKVFSLYELTYHGLSAFVRNLAHFVGVKVPEKLLKLLTCIRQATKLCIEQGFFDEEDSIVTSMLTKINQILNQMNGIEELRQKKVNRRGPQQAPPPPQLSIARRLSMYGNEKQTKLKKTKRLDRSIPKAHKDSKQSESFETSNVSMEETLISVSNFRL